MILKAEERRRPQSVPPADIGNGGRGLNFFEQKLLSLDKRVKFTHALHQAYCKSFCTNGPGHEQSIISFKEEQSTLTRLFERREIIQCELHDCIFLAEFFKNTASAQKKYKYAYFAMCGIRRQPLN